MVVKNQRPKAPPMTRLQAVSFDRFSVANAVTVETSLSCGCRAYEDVYTYRRWRAQGYQVIKGERAIKLPQVRVVLVENKETGETTDRRLFHTAAVFCKHQVNPIAEG